MLSFVGDVGSNLAAGWIAAAVSPVLLVMWKSIKLAFNGNLVRTLANLSHNRIVKIACMTPIALCIIYSYSFFITVAAAPFGLLIYISLTSISIIFSDYDIFLGNETPKYFSISALIIIHISTTLVTSKIIGLRIFGSNHPIHAIIFSLIDGIAIGLSLAFMIALFVGVASLYEIRFGNSHAAIPAVLFFLLFFAFAIYRAYCRGGFLPRWAFRELRIKAEARSLPDEDVGTADFTVA